MDVNLAMTRLTEITFIFPNDHQNEKEWNRTFGALLMGIPNCRELNFMPVSEKNLPSTSFRATSVNYPQIVLGTSLPIQAVFGCVSIRNGIDLAGTWEQLAETEAIDNVLKSSEVPNDHSITALYARLKGHLIDMDHSGVNIPVPLFEKSKWEELTQKLSQITNIYRYPGEEWPFIIPANEEEFQADITDFSAPRTLKFELVYDEYNALPILQFALITDLSRNELEEAFPHPYGYAIPGLEDIFRSVMVDSPWSKDVLIRIDLYYKGNEAELTDWETGEWLVKSGGRINY
ncbi:hypothetical protein EHS13_04095 [Paenibacillus psychroresistens]|uniref:Uncharacterized protein n=1 Tax=Paenibacillus psychroresistens TaxID=1778678 RepID=A0A6B8REI8_9BACL|nr:hypothetical protein [Paenibacillus psychroresistens]QGQ94144.1 hypothetical protein EHS13_04095 [Paenibacillus psychroresistens]